jgi:hypothetical protein
VPLDCSVWIVIFLKIKTKISDMNMCILLHHGCLTFSGKGESKVTKARNDSEFEVTGNKTEDGSLISFIFDDFSFSSFRREGYVVNNSEPKISPQWLQSSKRCPFSTWKMIWWWDCTWWKLVVVFFPATVDSSVNTLKPNTWWNVHLLQKRSFP